MTHRRDDGRVLQAIDLLLHSREKQGGRQPPNARDMSSQQPRAGNAGDASPLDGLDARLQVAPQPSLSHAIPRGTCLPTTPSATPSASLGEPLRPLLRPPLRARAPRRAEGFTQDASARARAGACACGCDAFSARGGCGAVVLSGADALRAVSRRRVLAAFLISAFIASC
jgi:hypothetical protein